MSFLQAKRSRLNFSLPVKCRGMTTLAGGDAPLLFVAMTVAMTLLSLLKAAICVRLIGTADVSGGKNSVCCSFSSEDQRVTS